MENEQFTLITCDLKGSICIDFNRFRIEDVKDIIANMDDMSKLTIRIPYTTEYSVIKDLYSSEVMTPEKLQRIILDFVDR